MSDAPNLEVPANGNRADSIANQLAGMNKRSIDLFFNVQKVAFEEMLDVSNDAIQRTSAEFSIANEFASKIAGAHSANDLKQVYEECGKHQADFFAATASGLSSTGNGFSIEPRRSFSINRRKSSRRSSTADRFRLFRSRCGSGLRQLGI